MFFALTKDGGTAPAPAVYVDMVLLPRHGYPYRKASKLGIGERYVLLRMLDWEAQYLEKK